MHNGHTQQNMKLDIVGNNTAVDPFGGNTAAALAYKKVEKLVTATHMVTNHIPDNNSLKQSVRDIASNLLADTIKLRSGLTSLGAGALSSIIARVRLTLSLLDALYASGLISEMNLKVLKEAYSSFTQNLSAMAEGNAGDAVVLTDKYFTEPVAMQQDSPALGQAQAPRVARAAITKKSKKQSVSQLSKPVKKAKAKSKINKKNSKFNTAPTSGRTQTIIDIITKNGSTSTGDIAQLVTACSSKTLQRDLAKLVATGTITKEGSKRWTRYSMA